MGERIYYLDHAAATPCGVRVVEAMKPYLSDVFFNPSASYVGGTDAKRALENARETIAKILGAKSYDIIFTAGATESINLAVRGVLTSGGHAVISGVEHPAVREAVKPYPHTIAQADSRGYTTPEMIKACVTDETTLVSVVMADNEFGTVQPLAEIARMLVSIREERRAKGNTKPLYFHTDASQGALALELQISRLGVDMMTLNAGKCYGPKQVGALWVNSGVRLEPLVYGGGQERSLRSGTENVAGAVGFSVALKEAQLHRHVENKRLIGMRTELLEKLTVTVPGFEIDGHPKKHLPGHIHFHVKGLDAERVVFHLDNEGIYLATGAACAANKATRSPSLEAIGLEPDEADGSLRITLGHLNDAAEIPYLATKIAEAIQAERDIQ